MIEKIKQINWYRHGHYRNKYLVNEYFWHSLGKEAFLESGIDFEFQNFLVLGWDHYADREETKKLVEKIKLTYKQNPKFLEEYDIQYRKDNATALAVAKEVGKLIEGSNAEIKQRFLRWMEFYKQHGHWVWSLEFVNEFVDSLVREKFTSNKEYRLFYDTCFIEEKLAFVKEKDDLLQIALLEKPDSALKKHCEEYAWLNMYWMNGEPYTIDHFKEKLQKIANPQEEITKRKKERDEEKGKYLSAISQMDKSTQELVETIRSLIFLKSYRVDVLTMTTYYGLPLLNEIAQRLGITRSVLLNLSESEICQGLDGNLDMTNYEKRKKEYGIVMIDGTPTRVSGDEARDIRKVMTVEDFSHLTEVKGQTGYSGLVRGIARVLETELELDKVQEGDILFTPMTNPNYVPCFDRIKAIVTDEGGVLSHSAMVSREMKIPCVIGVEKGTRVFKDGDKVEVDAEKGIVRKIK